MKMKHKKRAPTAAPPKMEEIKGDRIKVVKKRRKIKIRLADPDVPDSYICEVFDSSYENEETEKKAVKPKSYFDVMMSKESRRSFNVISAVENETIPEETKLLRVEESDEIMKSRKLQKGKNKEKLAHLATKKSQKTKVVVQSDSSDDECLFQVQSKLRSEVLKRISKTTQNGMEIASSSKEKLTKTSKEFKENNSMEEPAVPKQKTPNILNYFSKVRTSLPAKKPKPKARKLKEVDMFKSLENDPEVLIESDKILRVEKNANKKEKVKLAPMFQKKSSIDPNVQKARTEFLQSGLPSSIKKAIVMQRNLDTDVKINFFPTISHVQQRDDNICWTLRNVNIPSVKLKNDEYNINNKKFYFTISADCISENLPESSSIKVNEVSLNNLRCANKNIDIDSIFKGYQEKHDRHLHKLLDAKAEERNHETPNNSVEIICEDSNFEIFNCVWTEKYKPKSCEILGNEQAVKKLSKWLESWKAFDEEVKRLTKMGVKVKSKNATDDSDDFVTSDEDDYGLRTPGNTCLLSGPVGSGKTALVFSLANELEFNVLEVNASSKRTGKKLLTDLQEATKSHKVHHENNNLFEIQRKKRQKTKNIKTKKKKKKEAIESVQEPQTQCKISLILIEDADIVFEDHDEGFVAAISSLVQSSKRPVIFLASDAKCSHLDRFRTPQCLELEMFRPNLSSCCAVLDVISLLEGVLVRKNVLETLVQKNGCDLRRCLLELQFWIQCGGTLSSVARPLQIGQLWWGCNNFLYSSEIKHQAKPKSVKRKRIEDLFDSSSEDEGSVKKPRLEVSESVEVVRVSADSCKSGDDISIGEFSKILDCLSVIDVLHRPVDQEPIPRSEYRPSDSLSLAENLEAVDWSAVNLSNDLVGSLTDLSCRVFVKRKSSKGQDLKLSGPSWEEIRWRREQDEARQDLIALVPFNGIKESRNSSLDYLPIIRNICRTEKHRFTSNTKRKNRFYHYLRTVGADPNEDNLDISCAVFES